MAGIFRRSVNFRDNIRGGQNAAAGEDFWKNKIPATTQKLRNPDSDGGLSGVIWRFAGLLICLKSNPGGIGNVAALNATWSPGNRGPIVGN